MEFGIVTLFPEWFQTQTTSGVVGRAFSNGLLSLHTVNPRDYTTDVHRTVDDRPFGGGPGMVMKAEPLVRSVEALKTTLPNATVVMLSPAGKHLDQRRVREFVAAESLILVAGRYEGIDERFVERHVDEELSLGDFVLSGGEIAAMAVIDSVSRLVPGVLGHSESAQQDSFGESGLLDCPHYTRPEEFAGDVVPEVLLSGDHQAIAVWRREQSLRRTRERRKDLLTAATLTRSDEEFLKTMAADLNSGTTGIEE